MIRENHLFAAEEQEEKRKRRRKKREEEMEFGALIAKPRRLCFLPSQLAGWGSSGGRERKEWYEGRYPNFPGVSLPFLTKFRLPLDAHAAHHD